MARGELVQSLVRGLDILRLVAESGDGVELARIAAHLEVKSPTAHNLARTLVAQGFLEKTARPVRYRLGRSVWDLGAAFSKRNWIEKAERVVRSVSGRLAGATVILAERLGGEVCVSLRMEASRPEVVERYPGRVLAPYHNATGLCFLAFGAADESVTWRRRYPFDEYGAHRWEDEKRLDLFLRDVRRAGFVRIDGESPFRVAAPVFGAGGQLVAALGASSLVAPRPPTAVQDAMLAAVRDGARDVSAPGNAPAADGKKCRSGRAGISVREP